MPGNPDFAPQPVQAAPAPPPLPPAIWDAVSVQDLLNYIQQVGKEGLNPGDYDPVGLEAVIATRNPLLMSQAATERFNRLSSDLALGHVKKPGRIDWWVVDRDLDAARQDALLRSALAQKNIRAALDNLLPDSSAICGAQVCAGADAGDGHGEDAIESGSTWTVGAGSARSRPEVHHCERSGFPCDAGRKWREPVEAACDRRVCEDPDAAAFGACDPA